MTKRARADTEYQGHVVMGYINDLLTQGWLPEHGGNLAITIQNPTDEKLAKPWWQAW